MKILFFSVVLMSLLFVSPANGCLAGLRSDRLRHCDFNGSGMGRSLEQIGAIKSVFQTYGLDNYPSADVAYHVLPNGTVDVVQIQESEATPMQDYYYEQSVWEAAPFHLYRVPSPIEFFQIAFRDPVSKTSKNEKAPESAFVRIHLIPATVLNLFPNMFTKDEICGLENQESFDCQYSHSPLLQMYRSQWNYFLATNSNANKVQIQQKAAELKRVLVLLKQGGRIAERLSY
jgi:hypothetical protein